MSVLFNVIPAQAGIHEIPRQGGKSLVKFILKQMIFGLKTHFKWILASARMTNVCHLILILTVLFSSSPLSARDKNLPIPRFAAIRPDRANIRVGPGAGYPVEWVVVKSGVPVEITAEFDNWCRLNFPDGSQGWVHRNMLMGKRSAWVMSSDCHLFKSAGEDSELLAHLEKGALVLLQKCDGPWCQVKVDGFKGWVKRQDLWGVYPNEKLG